MKLYLAIVNERPVVASSLEQLEETLWELYGEGEYDIYEISLSVNYVSPSFTLDIED